MKKSKIIQMLINRIVLWGLVFAFVSISSVSLAWGIKMIHATKLFEILHDFNEPSEVAVSDNGLIYVVDGVNNKIKIFNNKGEYLSSFGKKGRGKGEFFFPLGIDIDDKGIVYIADAGNHRVQIFNPEGVFIAQIRLQSNTNKPADPTDVAIDEKRNRCYVVDNDNHAILVYDLLTHRHITTYGEPGTGKRCFRYPFLMTLDKDKYLYIVDVINTRVQVLNPDGLFVTDIGAWGVEKGQFFRPKGIALDNKNRVYVSDSYMGVVQVFQTSGEFFAVIGDTVSKAVKKFKTPMGLFVDKKDRLFVVEMFADKISVFQLGENDKDKLN